MIVPFFANTYQSPLPVFRPLLASFDELPAAAEAKLEAKGEGMVEFLNVILLRGVVILENWGLKEKEKELGNWRIEFRWLGTEM